MSFSNEQEPQVKPMEIRVRKPAGATFDSFEGGVRSTGLQARLAHAKQDWQVTDKMVVRSYSYSVDSIRIIFEEATVDIVAKGGTVDWTVHRFSLPALGSCVNPLSLVHVDGADQRELFDRDVVLRHIVGFRIRYSPSSHGLYLIWKPNHEIGIESLPLVDQEGDLLYCAGPFVS